MSTKPEMRERVRQEMTALLEQWRESGETRAVFARRHGVSLPKFDYWQRQLHPERMRRRPGRRVPGFAAVEVVSTPPPAGVLEVIFARGDRVIVRAEADVAVVRAVMSTLTPRC